MPWRLDGPIAFGADNRVFVDDVALATADAPENVSDTNTQVTGVDEADIVETDGNFIYSLNRGHLVITSIDASGSVEVVSRTELGVREWNVRGLYLAGDRLTVVSSLWNPPSASLIDFRWWPSESGQTSVVVYDITDRTAPVLQQETIVDGDYRDSRVVGEQLSLILNNRFESPFPEPHCEELAADSSAQLEDGQFVVWVGDELGIAPPADSGGLEIKRADDGIVQPPTHRFESSDDYRKRIAPLARELYEAELPGVYERADDASLDRLDDLFTIDDIVQLPESNGGSSTSGGVVDVKPARLSIWPGYNNNLTELTSIAVLDLTSDVAGVADAEAIELSSAGQVYADADSVYFARNHWSQSSTTNIYKFDVATGEVDFSASGSVDGYVSDHFALDEHNGYFRVVTTTSGYEDVDGEQRWVRDHELFVLEQVEDSFEVVGQLSEIGTNEQLHAVRFQGDRGFVVTFERVDPLFTLDLSDPTNPQLMGELIIPEFSDYLQPISDTHLIGIGRDENWNQQVSLFDVTDFANPTRVDTFSFDSGVHTDAQWDHHAVTYAPWDGVLTLPYQTSTRVDEPGHYGHRYVYETGVEVLQIQSGTDGKLQFDDLGAIEFGNSRHWHGGVRRTVRADHIVFSISGTEIQSHSVSDTSTLIDSADLSMIPGDELIPELDLDGSGEFTFATDGLMLLAYEFGSRGADLEGLRGTQMSRTGSQIADKIDRIADHLDVDGDGEFLFATDGIILLAHSFGIRGAGLDPFRAETGTRAPDDIGGYVAGLFVSPIVTIHTEEIDPHVAISGPQEFVLTMTSVVDPAIGTNEIQIDLTPTAAQDEGQIRVTADEEDSESSLSIAEPDSSSDAGEPQTFELDVAFSDELLSPLM